MEQLKSFLNRRAINYDVTESEINQTGASGCRLFFTEAKSFSYVSLSGGVFALSKLDIIELHKLMANAYKISKGKSGLKELCENIDETFHLFIDIEDKEEKIIFDNRILQNVIMSTLFIINEITPNFKYEDKEVFIARSSAFKNHKLHLIFKNIIVNKKLLKYIISRLKDNLPYDISDCIDNQAVNSLRMLGSKKCPPRTKEGKIDEEIDLFDFRKAKGWYTPCSFYKDTHFVEYGNMGITSQAYSDFSIKNVEELPLLEINKFSLFYLCEIDDKRIIENPPKEFINSCIKLITNQEYLNLIEQFLGGEYNATYWKWINIGKAIFYLSEGKLNGLELWIKLSVCEKYKIDEVTTSCSNRWRIFDEIDEEDIKIYLYSQFKKFGGNVFTDFLECKNKDIRKEEIQNKKLTIEYYKKLGEMCISEYYNDTESIISYSKFVDKNIYSTAFKFILLFAGLGKGKTKSTKDYISEDWNESKPIIWLSPRKTFTDSLMKDLKEIGFVSYDDKKVKGSIYQKRIVIQYESLHRINTNYYKDCLLISDEIESILSQVVSSTNGNNDEHNINTFGVLLDCASKVILSDAFLSNRVKTILCSIGHNPKEMGCFTYPQTQTKKLVIFESHKVWNKETKKQDVIKAEDKFYDCLTKKLKEGKKIYLFVSSKLRATQIYEIFKNVAILYTSETDESTEDVNKLWLDYQLIITTSKITIGIDCQIVFDNVFAIISANILTRDASQSLYRIRNVLGETFVWFDSRTKMARNPFVMSSLYKNLIYKTRGTSSIISVWENDGKRKFNMSLEGLRNRIEVSSILERAFNNCLHKQYGLHLLLKQGYILQKYEESQTLCGAVFLPINVSIFDEVPKITEEQYNELLTKAKNTKLTDIENACIKKYILLLYTHFPKYKGKDCKKTEMDITNALNGFGISFSYDEQVKNMIWSEFLVKDYKLRNVKHLFNLVNRDKEFFLKNTNQDLVLEKGLIAKKEVFDKIIEWFLKNNRIISHSEEFSKAEIRELFLLTDSMDFMDINVKKFNEKTSEKYMAERLNTFFENTFELKFKSGTYEEIEKMRKDENYRRQRTRERINGKRVDTTPYTLISEGLGICNFIKSNIDIFYEPITGSP